MKLTFQLCILFFIVNCSHQTYLQKSLNDWQKKDRDQRPLDFSTFPVSTEMEIGKAWPIFENLEEGSLITVGADRSFRLAAMINNLDQIFIIDVAKDVLTFNRINLVLLHAPTLSEYRQMRYELSYEDWKKQWTRWEGSKNEALPLSISDFDWWQKNVRDYKNHPYIYPGMLNQKDKDEVYDGEVGQKQKCVEDYKKNPAKKIDITSILKYKLKNYLFSKEYYQRLHQYVIEEKIHNLFIDLKSKKMVRSFVKILEENKINLTLIDLDNTYFPDYLGDKKYRMVLNEFNKVSNESTILMGMTNHKNYSCVQLQTYFGFRWTFVEKSFMQINFNDYLASLPVNIYEHINGKIYDLKHLPPFWTSWLKIKPKDASKWPDN